MRETYNSCLSFGLHISSLVPQDTWHVVANVQVSYI